MQLTTRRGQTFEIPDPVWSQYQEKYGVNAREEALTWLCRRAEHATLREAGPTQPPETWITERLTWAKLGIALLRPGAMDACRYNVGDLCDRVVRCRIMSAGQERELGGLIAEVTDEEALASLRAEWLRSWEFSTRPLGDGISQRAS